MESFTYSDFIKYFFDRPDQGKNEKWFFQEDYEDPVYNPDDPLSNKTLFIRYFCMAFQEIEKLSKAFSEKQFFCGLQYMIDSNCGGSFPEYFFTEEVPLSDRVKAVSLMFEVFEKVFDKVCSNNPEPEDLGEISYNRLCFMWWDMFSTEAMDHAPDIKQISYAILKNLDKILSLDNVMCKKSALHGLGHLCTDYLEKIEGIFNCHENEIPECLQEYASRAIRGYVE
jgi:hypothetical protein